MVHAPHNYVLCGSLGPTSVVVDCGPGSTADFSLGIIARFGARCHAFEPTRRHHASLQAPSEASATAGPVSFLPLAASSPGAPTAVSHSDDNQARSLLHDRC